MRLTDWRNLPAAQLTGWYARERQRWLDELGWESDPVWTMVERARESGRLPGIAALDDDAGLAGLTYFTSTAGTLRIGALSAAHATTARELLDAVLAAPEADLVERYHLFVFPDHSSVVPALERRRFGVEPYLYLERTLAGTSAGLPRSGRVRRWRDEDLAPVVRLLARAYAGVPAARSFAPHGRLDEWVQYASDLVRGNACGVFGARESVVWDAAEGDRPDGVVVTTWLAPRTAHIAQIAVDPLARRGGVARQLIAAASDGARDAGATRLTLLVSQSNAAARSLYGSLGFVERAQFLFADRDRITRGRVASALVLSS